MARRRASERLARFAEDLRLCGVSVLETAGDESGQTLVEYVLLVALIAAVALAAVAVLGGDVSGFVQNVADAI